MYRRTREFRGSSRSRKERDKPRWVPALLIVAN